MKAIDLHTHSTASDGTLTPAELARAAKDAGLSVIAITDHDTVSGAEEFLSECERVGITGIAGVEISAKFRTEMHILGLFVDYTDAEFIEKLAVLKNARSIRNREMIKRLHEAGFDVSEEDILALKDGATLDNTGRAHIASILRDKGYVTSVQEAFDKYLSRGCPFYVPRVTYPPAESIAMIKKAGGIAVLAHPIFITREREELRALLADLQAAGLDGVETYYSEYDEEFTQMCSELADEVGLLKTGGSDFHGANKPHIALGRVYGGFVAYELYERLVGKRGREN